MKTLLSGALLFCIGTFVVAGTHAPLPKKLIDAKTVFLDNRTGKADIGDKAYDELTKWGRFKVVDDVKTADVVFVLSTETWSAGTYTYGSVSDSGNISATSVARSSGTTYLTVFDSEGHQIWADSRDWGRYKSATRGIIKNLRDRMEKE